MSNVIEFDQYPTPAWVAEALVREHFSDLKKGDVVYDPTCGPGRFLGALPPEVKGIGVEIDPVLAQQARDLTGRQVIVGDFLKVDLPDRPIALIGNPPFQMKLVDQILDRAHELLPDDGRVAFLLPTYAFQTSSRVVRYSERWSLSQTMIPRNIYPGLSKPLMWAMFRKDQKRLLIGLSLYMEAHYIQKLPKDQREAMISGPATWVGVVLEGIKLKGGEADLWEIYEYVASRRPSRNPHWKEQVRKVCQTRARRTARGRYASPLQAELF